MENQPFEDGGISALDDIFSSARSRKKMPSSRKYSLHKDSRFDLTYASNSLKFDGSKSDAERSDVRKEDNSLTAPYVQNESPERNQRGSIRDMIKFYDGSKC